ncbi:MAG: hypothetical protein KDB14_34565 [Planctomycetales bacterium]|nr:hypothetical protein [Planctomycetales bacterium]
MSAPITYLPPRHADLSEREALPTAPAKSSSWRRWPARLAAGGEWLIGFACLLVGLAIVAAIPVLQILSFGYLLEVSGRIAREGRLRAGFIGVPKAARVGLLIAHSWLMLLPIRLVSDAWYEAQLIDPLGPAARNLRGVQLVLLVLTMGHLISAWYCGGRARHFYWPLLSPIYLWRTWRGRLRMADWLPPLRMGRDLRLGEAYRRSRDRLWDFCVSLRLPYYFRLGGLGLLGAACWLAVPVLLLAGAAALPPGAAALAGLAGGLCLAFVAVRLPFIETNFATEGDWDRMLDRRLTGQQFARAPLAFWIALLLTLGLAIPLHLIQAAPPLLPDLRWLLNLLFVILLLPARFAAGWAVARAKRRETPRFVVSRWGARLAAVPVAMFYALIVYLSQFINFYGSWRLLEQPAFMLPAPFWLI